MLGLCLPEGALAERPAGELRPGLAAAMRGIKAVLDDLVAQVDARRLADMLGESGVLARGALGDGGARSFVGG